MPTFSIEKSIKIAATIDDVYTVVKDFKKWPIWSPWLIAEPGCEIVVAEDKLSYSWSGKIVGSGRMEIIDDKPNERISYQLTFLTPWKSISTVEFLFQAKGNLTNATWTMNGSLPFFMFWMKKMMIAFIGMDYHRGLLMLKDFCETGAVPSKLEFLGKKKFEGNAYLGIKTSCPISEIGDRMKIDFEKLNTAISEAQIESPGYGFSIYHKHDLVNRQTEYTAGILIPSPPSSAPSSLHIGKIESCETYAIRHTGPYHHLGNAWTAGMMHAKSKLFKQNKTISPFEIYENNPYEVRENELQTCIYFPSK